MEQQRLKSLASELEAALRERFGLPLTVSMSCNTLPRERQTQLKAEVKLSFDVTHLLSDREWAMRSDGALAAVMENIRRRLEQGMTREFELSLRRHEQIGAPNWNHAHASMQALREMAEMIANSPDGPLMVINDPPATIPPVIVGPVAPWPDRSAPRMPPADGESDAPTIVGSDAARKKFEADYMRRLGIARTEFEANYETFACACGESNCCGWRISMRPGSDHEKQLPRW